MPANFYRRLTHSTRLTFVDPKALRNLDLTHPKIGLCKEVNTEQREGHLGQVELHVQTGTGAKLQVLTVNDGGDLQQLAKREVYADFRVDDVAEITSAKGQEFMALRYPELALRLTTALHLPSGMGGAFTVRISAHRRRPFQANVDGVSS
jgi:hypothetical protein